MKRYFVIGDRASNSLSPLIFNHWFKKYKINAKYTYIQIKKNKLKETILNTTNNKDVGGFNVTIPYKKDVIRFIKKINKDAKAIKAVNCVINEKESIGINTDWIGYKNSLKSHNISKSKHVIILGYGGAAKAIYYALRLGGFNNIYIFNRSKKLIKILGCGAYTKKYNTVDKHLHHVGLLINTTPVNPLSKKQSQNLNNKAIVSDIVYKPKETPFLRSFKNNKKIYGFSMLLQQASPCFKAWFGFEPQIDKALLEKLHKKLS